MKYFVLEPEVAGGLGPGTVLDSISHPPRVSKLDYEFSGWLGDALLESFPCFIVLAAVADALKAASFTGYGLHEVEISMTRDFESTYPGRLPQFRWLKINGVAGQDDFGLAGDHRLVVSDRALGQLQQFGLSHAVVEQA